MSGPRKSTTKEREQRHTFAGFGSKECRHRTGGWHYGPGEGPNGIDYDLCWRPEDDPVHVPQVLRPAVEPAPDLSEAWTRVEKAVGESKRHLIAVSGPWRYDHGCYHAEASDGNGDEIWGKGETPLDAMNDLADRLEGRKKDETIAYEQNRGAR